MPHALAERAAARDGLADHLPALRARLEHQHRFRREQVAALNAVLEDSRAFTDAADRARHEVTVKVAAAARQALLDIEAALTLIADGGYGRCRACHADIPLRLLQAIPTSRWCLDCRQRLTQADSQHPARERRPHATSGPSRHRRRRTPHRDRHGLTPAGQR